jgi:hypothetical protein
MTYSIIGATALILFLFAFVFGIFIVELIPEAALPRLKNFIVTMFNKENNTV